MKDWVGFGDDEHTSYPSDPSRSASTVHHSVREVDYAILTKATVVILMCGFELDAIAQEVAVTRSWIFGVSPIISLTGCHVFRCRVFRVPNASLL
ncbi:unnamed protein product [Ectocarpus sp. CCAP 1310/34]|nr:unnamed protein product [Ectocarpus sp. CCAP 1310/34]